MYVKRGLPLPLPLSLGIFRSHANGCWQLGDGERLTRNIERWALGKLMCVNLGQKLNPLKSKYVLPHGENCATFCGL